MKRLRLTTGNALMAIGVLHTTYGLSKYRQTLGEIARDGVVDAVEGDREREVAFWFLTCGASMVVTGRLAGWAQRRTGTLPVSTGRMLLAISTAGAILMPRSGFWSVFLPAILALGAARRAAAPKEV